MSASRDDERLDGGRLDRRALLGAGALALTAGLRATAEERAPGKRVIDTEPGPHVLRFELPGVEVGCAVDPAGPTGCTVVSFPRRALTVADVRGGTPVTSNTDLARERSHALDAICLAGGSVYGLDAAGGVARELFERAGRATGWERIARVSGAVIYDFGLRTTSVVPDADLGRAALKAARPGVVPLGGRGAGAAASVGKWFPGTLEPELAGQGAACRALGRSRVLVLTVVNALGAIVDRSGQVVRGHRDPKTGRRVAVSAETIGPRPSGKAPGGGNTTLTVVVTNRLLDPGLLRQLAKEVHASMARAIHPFHGLSDGDVLFAVSTGELDDPGVNAFQLAALASACAWDAVLSSFTGRR
ncbi:MAG: P1 family peptidase [Planctomycetota bacterium]